MDEIFKEVADTLGIPVNTVKSVITTFMSYIRMNITKKVYRNLDSLEGVKTNFSLPGFGKLAVKNKLNRSKLNEKEKNREVAN
jgi:nucleoid DNA-binding protein